MDAPQVCKVGLQGLFAALVCGVGIRTGHKPKKFLAQELTESAFSRFWRSRRGGSILALRIRGGLAIRARIESGLEFALPGRVVDFRVLRKFAKTEMSNLQPGG
jgi:hypothetical protein